MNRSLLMIAAGALAADLSWFGAASFSRNVGRDSGSIVVYGPALDGANLGNWMAGDLNWEKSADERSVIRSLLECEVRAFVIESATDGQDIGKISLSGSTRLPTKTIECLTESRNAELSIEISA